jgi:histone H3/H4
MDPLPKEERMEAPAKKVAAKKPQQKKPQQKKVSKKPVSKKPTMRKSKKRARAHLPRDDLQLLSSHAGIRTLVRREGARYGNTRVSSEAIDYIKERRTDNLHFDDVLAVIDIASKSASEQKRKTVLLSDVVVAYHAINRLRK